MSDLIYSLAFQPNVSPASVGDPSPNKPLFLWISVVPLLKNEIMGTNKGNIMRKMEGKIESEELWQQRAALPLPLPPSGWLSLSLSLLPSLPTPLLSCSTPPCLPRSPAQSCSKREGLLGLASLQCREGKGGSFSTMR